MNTRQITVLLCGMAAILLLDLIEKESSISFHLALLSVVVAAAVLFYTFRDKKARNTKNHQRTRQ